MPNVRIASFIPFGLTRPLYAVMLAAAACAPVAPHGSRPPPGDGVIAGATRTSVPVVVFRPEGLPLARVTVEVVRTEASIRRGLMFRRYLPSDHGMLFMMGEERVHSFWMRDTLVSLDMIFIASDLTVAGVVAHTVPLTDDSNAVDRPSLYVLEVNAGWAAAHGVRADTRVDFVGVD